MISKPFPEASSKLNAWVTALTCQWLMGPCKVNDIELPDGTVAKGQGVLVERYGTPGRIKQQEKLGTLSAVFICLSICFEATQALAKEIVTAVLVILCLLSLLDLHSLYFGSVWKD